MASITTSQQRLDNLGIHSEEHPVWEHAFNADARLRQVEDDLLAGKSVSGVLMAIVTAGVVLSLLCVMFAM